MGYAQLGVPFSSILIQLSKPDPKTGSYSSPSLRTSPLISLFSQQDYIMWYSPSLQTFSIVLKSTADASTHLKAWLHALVCAKRINDSAITPKDSYSDDWILEKLHGSLDSINGRWPTLQTLLLQKGWDIFTDAIETRSGTRIEIHPKMG